MAILLRHGPPHKMDEAPYGSLCRVERGDNYDIYIQVNLNDEEEPIWRYVDLFGKGDSLTTIKEKAEKMLQFKNTN